MPWEPRKSEHPSLNSPSSLLTPTILSLCVRDPETTHKYFYLEDPFPPLALRFKHALSQFP